MMAEEKEIKEVAPEKQLKEMDDYELIISD